MENGVGAREGRLRDFNLLGRYLTRRLLEGTLVFERGSQLLTFLLLLLLYLSNQLVELTRLSFFVLERFQSELSRFEDDRWTLPFGQGHMLLAEVVRGGAVLLLLRKTANF